MRKGKFVLLLICLFFIFQLSFSQSSGELKSKIKLDTSYNHGKDIYALASAGNNLAFGDENGDLFLINSNLNVLNIATGISLWVNCLAVNSSNSILVAGCSEGDLYFHNITNNSEIKRLKLTKAAIKAVKFLSDSAILAASDKLYLININSGNVIKSFDFGIKILSLEIENSAKTVYVGLEDGKIMIFDAVKFKPLKNLTKHKRGVTAISISEDKKELITGDASGLVYVWTLKSGKAVKSISAHIDEISSLLFSPDKKYIITAGWDKNIFIWDRKKYILELNINAHKNIVTSVIFWNGKLVTAGYDNNIKIWSNF